MKKNKPDAMIIDDFGNIYYSAASLNELKEKYKEELALEKNSYNRMYNMYAEIKERNEKAIEYMDNTYEINDTKELFYHYKKVESIIKGEDKE